MKTKYTYTLKFLLFYCFFTAVIHPSISSANLFGVGDEELGHWVVVPNGGCPIPGPPTGIDGGGSPYRIEGIYKIQTNGLGGAGWFSSQHPFYSSCADVGILPPCIYELAEANCTGNYSNSNTFFRDGECRQAEREDGSYDWMCLSDAARNTLYEWIFYDLPPCDSSPDNDGDGFIQCADCDDSNATLTDQCEKRDKPDKGYGCPD